MTHEEGAPIAGGRTSEPQEIAMFYRISRPQGLSDRFFLTLAERRLSYVGWNDDYPPHLEITAGNSRKLPGGVCDRVADRLPYPGRLLILGEEMKPWLRSASAQTIHALISDDKLIFTKNSRDFVVRIECKTAEIAFFYQEATGTARPVLRRKMRRSGHVVYLDVDPLTEISLPDEMVDDIHRTHESEGEIAAVAVFFETFWTNINPYLEDPFCRPAVSPQDDVTPTLVLFKPSCRNGSWEDFNDLMNAAATLPRFGHTIEMDLPRGIAGYPDNAVCSLVGDTVVEEGIELIPGRSETNVTRHRLLNVIFQHFLPYGHKAVDNTGPRVSNIGFRPMNWRWVQERRMVSGHALIKAQSKLGAWLRSIGKSEGEIADLLDTKKAA